jgi:hypothetical protein
MQIAPACGR